MIEVSNENRYFRKMAEDDKLDKASSHAVGAGINLSIMIKSPIMAESYSELLQ